jgi:hypothetical protein
MCGPLVGYSEVPYSGACSAFSVGGTARSTRASVLGNASSVPYPNLAGEIPARESSPTLFGWRLGRCPVVNEMSAYVLGTAE